MYRQVHTDNDKFIPEKASELDYGACKGCKSSQNSEWCVTCVFKECAISKGYGHCGECPDFPCQEIQRFEYDEVSHHDGVIDNLKRVLEIGVDQWLIEQSRKWQCDKCGTPQHWYSDLCHNCGTARQ